MKTKIRLITALVTVLALSSCVDLFDTTDTLVYGYCDQPWMIRTKATTDYSANSTDMYYMSIIITGGEEWRDIDHLIYMSLNSGRNGTLFTARENSEEFFRLCKKHGDTSKSPVGCFSAHSGAPNLYHFYQDFISIEVTCEEDFDSNHPAGSSLLDIIHYGTDSPYRVLKNNYQLTFENNALSVFINDDHVTEGKRFEQIFNTFKKGNEVTSDDLAILGDIYISFDKYPDVIEPKHIHIRMTADNGQIYTFDTVLTFEVVEGFINWLKNRENT